MQHKSITLHLIQFGSILKHHRKSHRAIVLPLKKSPAKCPLAKCAPASSPPANCPGFGESLTPN